RGAARQRLRGEGFGRRSAKAARPPARPQLVKHAPPSPLSRRVTSEEREGGIVRFGVAFADARERREKRPRGNLPAPGRYGPVRPDMAKGRREWTVRSAARSEVLLRIPPRGRPGVPSTVSVFDGKTKEQIRDDANPGATVHVDGTKESLSHGIQQAILQ